MTGLAYPDGNTIRYTYDGAGQMTAATDWSGNTTRFDYGPDGLLARRSDANDVATAVLARDPAGQITGIDVQRQGTTLGGFTYSYDTAGLLSADTATSGARREYAFDQVDQLASVSTIDGGSRTVDAYSITSAGQLTEMPNGTRLAYNAAQELITSTRADGRQTSYRYDANGARTAATAAEGTTAYRYTTGALAGVTKPDGTNVAYVSDGSGLRRSRTENGTTTRFVWATVGGMPLLLNDGDHSYLYGPDSTPYAQVDRSGAVTYLHGDNIGSIRLVTDAAGDVVARSAYDAYGNRVAHTGPADSRIGFTGNWTDASTGLIHLRARDYDPATGQFSSSRRTRRPRSRRPSPRRARPGCR